MENLKHLIKGIFNRQKLLPDNIKEIQHELEYVYEKNINAAGVIDRGYFSSFDPVLEKHRSNKLISTYHLTEEEYVSGDRLIKIPVVDLYFINEQSSRRIFILSKSLMREFKLEELIN